MRIVQCRFNDPLAREAFRLRYDVFIDELGYTDPKADHANGLYCDELDAFSRIYVALNEQEQVIATARSIYLKDLDERTTIPPPLLAGFDIELFYHRFRASLAISTKFVVAKNYRRTLAAHMITLSIFKDLVDDEIFFVFSTCAPSLLSFYRNLGFRNYSPPDFDQIGMYFPIILSVYDDDFFNKCGSPFRRITNKLHGSAENEAAIRWFKKTFSERFDRYVFSINDDVIDDLIETTTALEASSKVTIFSDIAIQDRRRIMSQCLAMRVLAGQTIMASDQTEGVSYLILDGQVDVSREAKSLKPPLGKGDVITECNDFTHNHKLTYIARMDCTLLIVSISMLNKLSKQDSALAKVLTSNIIRSVAQRMRQRVA